MTPSTSGDIKIVGETYTDNWDPAKAQTEMEQFLTAANNDVQAVLSENDGMAGGVVAALEAQGLAGKVPVSGQDGDQAALNRVALGTQTVDVWKDARELGKTAGEAAVQLCANPDVTEGQRHRAVHDALAATTSRRSCSRRSRSPRTTSTSSSTPAGSTKDDAVQGRRRPVPCPSAADRRIATVHAPCARVGAGTTDASDRRRSGDRCDGGDPTCDVDRRQPTASSVGWRIVAGRRPRSTRACSAWWSPWRPSGSRFNVLSGGDFLTARNLWNLSVQSTSIAIMATGMVLIIVSRNIDLSVGSLLGFLGYTMAMVQTDGVDPSTSRSASGFGQARTCGSSRWPSASCSAPLIGAVRASSSPTSGCPSFIVTLGGFLVWRGLIFRYGGKQGQTLAPLDEHLPAARRRHPRARSASGGAGCSAASACAGDRAQHRRSPAGGRMRYELRRPPDVASTSGSACRRLGCGLARQRYAWPAAARQPVRRRHGIVDRGG